MKKLAIALSILVLLSMSASAASDWPQAMADARHTSHAAEALIPPLKMDWSKDMGGPVVSSPVISNGTVYAANSDKQTLLALDERTGGQLWQFKTDSTIESTPAVVNGSVFLGSYDGYIYRLDAASGRMLWRSNVNSGMYSSPLVYDGRVYVGTDGDVFYALDVETGRSLWTLNNITQSSPAAWNGRIYIGTYGYQRSSQVAVGDTSIMHGMFYALDASSGNVTWSYDCGDQVHSSPSIFNGTVYVADHSGMLYAFDADSGKVKWQYDLGYYTDTSPSIDEVTGSVYIGTYGGHVFALDASDGSLKWTSGFLGPIYSTLAVSGNDLYGATQDGTMFALSAVDGSSLWKYDTGASEIFSSPAIADGRLFIGTMDGKLMAFEHTDVSPTPSPSATNTKPAATPFLDLTACILILAAVALLRRER